jgi:hypothetical protein
MMATDDPILHIYAAYKAYMAEHTGLSWLLVERFLEVDREFWSARPEATAQVRDFLQGA